MSSKRRCAYFPLIRGDEPDDQGDNVPLKPKPARLERPPKQQPTAAPKPTRARIKQMELGDMKAREVGEIVGKDGPALSTAANRSHKQGRDFIITDPDGRRVFIKKVGASYFREITDQTLV